MNEIRNKLLCVLNRCNIVFEDDTIMNLDSFTYINAIVEIENEFNIEIPDAYLTQNIFESMDGLCEIINELI